MTGFAVIIFASQFHVMLDEAPLGTPLANLLHLPARSGQNRVDMYLQGTATFIIIQA